MKHIVIGGNGFTGRYLVKDLVQQGYHVVVCDIEKSDLAIYSSAGFIRVDIADRHSLTAIPLEPDDIVYHLAARQYHMPVPWRGRRRFFHEVNVRGTVYVLDYLEKKGCPNLIYFSTDMVYGLPRQDVLDTEHPLNPLGPYGESKKTSENFCRSYRERGLRITIFRPRLIIGPGRMGVLARLFRLIDLNLPVPLIGNGSNRYQMISVFDCVSAVTCAVAKGIPNEEYNLGSKDPPEVRELLKQLIVKVGSRSRLMKTPASLVKTLLDTLDYLGLTLLYKEQYAIADLNYLVDISKTEEQLGWHPQYRDEDMIYEAYREYERLRSPAAKEERSHV